jgi:hypothetical protein
MTTGAVFPRPISLDRRHVYSLAKFGLSEARVRRDLAFAYERYDLAPRGEGASPPRPENVRR